MGRIQPTSMAYPKLFSQKMVTDDILKVLFIELWIVWHGKIRPV
jgi:hypothetical protein